MPDHEPLVLIHFMAGLQMPWERSSILLHTIEYLMFSR
jgi:hypothetical protein